MEFCNIKPNKHCIYNRESNMATITKFDKIVDIIGFVNLIAYGAPDLFKDKMPDIIKYIALFYLGFCAVLYIILMLTRWKQLTPNKKKFLPLGAFFNIFKILFSI
jgi:hypothetical protein